MHTATTKEIISNLASNGRRYYSQLTDGEKRELIAAMMVEQELIWKTSVLTDADDLKNPALPTLVANIIATNGAPAALHNLFKKLLEIFVTGSTTQEAYFASDVDCALEEIWEARENPISYLEELRQADARERTRDMQLELKKTYY